MAMNDDALERAGTARPCCISGACAAALLLGSSAHADEAPRPLNDRFQVSVGTYLVTSEPIVQLNGETEQGDRLYWDKRFGRLDANRIRLEAQWRFADRHKLRAIAFSLSRERNDVLHEDIHWGDATYPVDAEVRAEFSFEVVEIAYEYAFRRGERYELCASMGIHYTRLDASLEATAEASNGTLSEDLSGAGRVHAPLPVIGLSGTWSLSHDLWLEASAQFFALSVEEYDGYLERYGASLSWQPRSWLGIGVGYNLFAVDVEVANNGFNGALDWRYGGPMLFYRASF
jgi:hypothetical protein